MFSFGSFIIFHADYCGNCKEDAVCPEGNELPASGVNRSTLARTVNGRGSATIYFKRMTRTLLKNSDANPKIATFLPNSPPKR